jgi:hypothetical protein
MTTTNPPATAQPTNQAQQSKPKILDDGAAPMVLGPGGQVRLSSMKEAFLYCEWLQKSGLAPKNDTASQILVKLQAGAELGFPPMRALASLVVVNGKLTLQGDAMLALIRASGKGRVIVGVTGEGENRVAHCDIERFDTKEKDRVTFSWQDAKRAGLTGKDTYKSYGEDMLIWKAVARAARRYFSDVIGGVSTEEDARTYEPTPYVPVTVQPSNARQLAAPPPGDDPLMVEPSSAENVAAEQLPCGCPAPACQGHEAPLLDPAACPHEGIPASLRDNLAQGEELGPCNGCGTTFKGPGKNVVAKAEKAKGQGRIA